MTYEARLEIGVDSRDAKRDVDGLDNSLGRVEKSGDRADKATRRFGKGARSTAMELNRLRTVAIGFVGAIGGAAALRSIVRASDTYTNLRSQLRLVTDSQEELNQVYEQTFKVAQDTRQDFEGTVNLYARMARATEELDLSNQKLLTVTKAINQSFVISGASAQEAGSAMLQLSQGIASGTLRGEELNSVLENSPRLARAIAEGMGVTIGQLRELGANGELTAERILDALSKTAAGIDQDFSKMERTVGQAMQQLRNDLTNTFGRTDTSEFVDAIDELREIVSDPGFRSSMVTLGSAIATLAGWMAEAAGATIDFTKSLSEDLAAAIHGVSSEDIARLNEQLSEQREVVASLRELFDSSGGISDSEQTILDRENDKLSQYARLLEEAVRNRRRLVVGDGDGQESGEKGVGSGSGTRLALPASGIDIKGLREQEKALDRIVEAASARTAAFRDAAEADREMQQARIDALEDVRASLRTEEEAILASHERRRREILEITHEGDLERRQLLLRLQADTNEQLSELNRGFWENYLASAQDALTSMDDIAAGTIETFSGGMGSAFESMIFDAKTAREAFQQLGEGMARSIVNALGKMAAEWLAYQAVQLLVGKTTAAAGAAAMVANAQASSAMASLNAFASTAAIPVVGPAAAPAAAAAAAAATAPLVATVAATSFAGSFDGGGFTGIGPRSGGIDGKGGFPAILHPNETVIDHTKGKQMPQASPQVNFRNINVLDRSLVGDYLATDEGEQMILNVMQRNRGAL